MRNSINKIISFLIVLSVILPSVSLTSHAEEKINVSARAAVLYSPDTDVFLYLKNADVRLPMASTTKIMTALIVLEKLNLDKTVTVNAQCVGIEGSSIYLKAGDMLTVRDLLYSLLLRSANDAACVLAYEVSGGIEEFAILMNERAINMGLKDTSFKNPHGLDDKNHYTTARELALITAEAMKNSDFCEITSTYKYSFPLGDSIRTVVNHNKLLKSYEGAVGVKTGFTQKCGRCLVGAAEKDGITLISVTLDAPDDWRDHKSLFDYGFSNLKATYLDSLKNFEHNLSVIGGNKEYISTSLKDNTPIISSNNDIFEAEIIVNRFLSAPIKQNEIVGQVIIYKNGVFYETRDLISNESVAKRK